MSKHDLQLSTNKKIFYGIIVLLIVVSAIGLKIMQWRYPEKFGLDIDKNKNVNSSIESENLQGGKIIGEQKEKDEVDFVVKSFGLKAVEVNLVE